MDEYNEVECWAPARTMENDEWTMTCSFYEPGSEYPDLIADYTEIEIEGEMDVELMSTGDAHDAPDMTIPREAETIVKISGEGNFESTSGGIPKLR
jgi:hypothetical protein